MIKVFIWAYVIYDAIVLSSGLFLSLYDAIEVIARLRFLVGTIACWIVLAFELYGL